MQALLLIDLQNDFCRYGALAVTDGNAVVPLANDLAARFDLVVATQDWHPADHGSFAANHLWSKPGQTIILDGLEQILWPVHCVQESFGAQFVNELNLENITEIFQKGTDPLIDSYSGFYDNGHRKSTGLAEYLKEKGVKTVYIAGLATDYCVKFTALDAVKEGFETYVIADACRGVNLQADDSENALAEMQAAGAKIVQSSEVLSS